MNTKFLEIRDRGTLIPVLAVEITGDSHPLAKHAGFGGPQILLINLVKIDVNYDPFNWKGGRTLQIAHRHIERVWPVLTDGEVVDVEFILGEAPTPKTPEVK